MADISDTLAALSGAATQDNPWFYGEPEVGLEPEPFFGRPLEGGMRPLQPMTRQDAEFVTALWNAYRTGQLVPVPSVEMVSKAVHEALCRVDVIRYLDLPPQTAENVAMVVIAAMKEGK